MKGYLIMPIFDKLFRRFDRGDAKKQEMRNQLPAKMVEVAEGTTFARTVWDKREYMTAEEANSLIEIGDSIQCWFHRYEGLLQLSPDDYNNVRRNYNKARYMWQASQGTLKVSPLFATFEAMCSMYGGAVPETIEQVTDEEKIVRMRRVARATYVFLQRIDLILQRVNQRINLQSPPHQSPLIITKRFHEERGQDLSIDH